MRHYLSTNAVGHFFRKLFGMGPSDNAVKNGSYLEHALTTQNHAGIVDALRRGAEFIGSDRQAFLLNNGKQLLNPTSHDLAQKALKTETARIETRKQLVLQKLDRVSDLSALFDLIKDSVALAKNPPAPPVKPVKTTPVKAPAATKAPEPAKTAAPAAKPADAAKPATTPAVAAATPVKAPAVAAGKAA